YALTFKPTVYGSHIRQFWSTAMIETTEERTKILATIDGILRTVTESSLRRNLKLQDEEGISRIVPLFDTMLVLQGKGSDTPTETHHTPSPEAQQTIYTTHSSPTLPPVTTAPIPTWQSSKTSEEVLEEVKSPDEVPKEKVKEMMQLVSIEENMMHAPVEWKLYESCEVHHVTSKDNEIFMLIEKDYPLRKGLAIVMICYKLHVENYSQMANDLILKIYKIANCPTTAKACAVFKLKCEDVPSTLHLKDNRPAMAESLKGCPAKIWPFKFIIAIDNGYHHNSHEIESDRKCTNHNSYHHDSYRIPFTQNVPYVGNKMHKAFPLPVMEFLLPKEVPTSSKESTHCQKKSNATATQQVMGTSKKKGRTVTVTAEDTKKRKNDVKARTTLLLSLPDEHQL
nr:hypothetical protein [Tanacetum cinerariifolium]